MIGLGTNRLSASRLAGLREASQFRNGQWIEEWWSPYSKAAARALKAAFSAAQWAIIRDYGFAHPEIVGYMNAYAVEDAKIAYSLVEGIGLRTMVTDGTAYSITNLTPNSTTKVYTAVKRTATGSYKYIFGACGSAGKSSYYFLGANGNSWYNEVRGSNNNFGTATQGVHYVLTFTTLQTTVDGTVYDHGGTGVLGANTAKIAIGRAINQSGGIYDNPWIGSIDYFKVETDGVLVGYFIPFKRNGAMEWLDLITGSIATKVGTWTELIESPS